MRKQDLSLTNVERSLDPDELIVTKTDLSGKIRYGNRTFYKFAGYSPAECVGTQHNIIRHPAMPRTVFKLLWDTIKTGDEVFAYVNNRSKNGDNYWVFAHVTPSWNEAGKIVGYHSNRRAPNKTVIHEHIEPLYAALLEIERTSGSPKDALAAGERQVHELLQSKGMSFNELMFALGV
ncbi:PAS domain-containing protein [Nisaea acidiphila]|uniref:PAS domain-containing protein n=1 Tax=Nisaea acidiphila TaxID=1862145 RepID=A0A9J7AR52_9PROT|nr:PAS domain-containing protein [Nisaea acidiphila]UUX48820.1 PAS domain-containing protein [Nisaea acidiphila]